MIPKGYIGGTIPQTGGNTPTGILPGAPTGTGFMGGGVITPGSIGTTSLGGGLGSIPRPFIGGGITLPPPRPTPVTNDIMEVGYNPYGNRGNVPFHTHTMNENGWQKETGGPTRNRRRDFPIYNFPKPYTPRPLPGKPIKPKGNIGTMMGQYSNASGGGGCSLWMCGE